MDNELLKENFEKYLNSKLHAGGLYGLTISDEDFIPGLVEMVEMSESGKKFDPPAEEISEDLFC